MDELGDLKVGSEGRWRDDDDVFRFPDGSEIRGGSFPMPDTDPKTWEVSGTITTDASIALSRAIAAGPTPGDTDWVAVPKAGLRRLLATAGKVPWTLTSGDDADNYAGMTLYLNDEPITAGHPVGEEPEPSAINAAIGALRANMSRHDDPDATTLRPKPDPRPTITPKPWKPTGIRAHPNPDGEP